MAKFYGQRRKENLLHEIVHKKIQIPTCHRYISICPKTRELLLQFCEQEHSLPSDIHVTFTPDYYDRIRISIENLPIELPDEDVKEFLTTYATPIGKTYYTGKRYNNKYYTTGTRVYQCIHLKQHLPRHIYQFGRYLRIRYNSQPTPDPTATLDNNINGRNTNENTDKTPKPTNKIYNQIPKTTPIPVTYDTPTIATTKPVVDTTDITTQPTENIQTENTMTDQQTDTDTETETETETTTTKRPTLNSYEKMVSSLERQIHTLYWRGYVNFEGKMKKRYELYPNQLYRVITDRNELEIYCKKDESGHYSQYNDIQNEIRQASRYFDKDRQKDIIIRKEKT